MRLLDKKGDVRPEVLQKNLKMAIQVLDAVYLDEAIRWVPFQSCSFLINKWEGYCERYCVYTSKSIRQYQYSIRESGVLIYSA